MLTIRFIRTTHENGPFRSFSPEAIQFWREQGVTVGEVLRPECALTFAELAAADYPILADATEQNAIGGFLQNKDGGRSQ